MIARTPEEFSRLLAAATGRNLEHGHAVELVANGRIFEALEQELARARVSVHITMYIWKPGEASDRLLRVIEAKRREGVPVRIVVDHMGSRGGFREEVLPKLEAAGCEVRQFHVPGKTSAAKTLARNHRKIVVVDGRVAFVGGWCIWDKFLGEGLAEEDWRDTNARITGPSVRFMQEAFLRNWREAGGELPPLSELPWPDVAAEGAGTPGGFVHSSSADVGVTGARALLRTVLPIARSRLWIASAYFSPDEELLDLLTARARAGVDVRVLVPGPVHDVPPIREAGRSLYPALLRDGVRIYEYQPSMMHAKTLVVDDALCVIGSINLEPTSMNLLEEGAAVMWSRELVAELARAFEQDCVLAKEITPETQPAPALNPARASFRRVWESVAGLLRRRRVREEGEAAV